MIIISIVWFVALHYIMPYIAMFLDFLASQSLYHFGEGVIANFFGRSAHFIIQGGGVVVWMVFLPTICIIAYWWFKNPLSRIDTD